MPESFNTVNGKYCCNYKSYLFLEVKAMKDVFQYRKR